MTPEEIKAYIMAGAILLTEARVSIEKIRGMFAEAGMSEADLNTICDAVAADAAQRKAIAEADAGGPLAGTSTTD